MNYLLYVEHCAENLQFYLWYRDYVERFEKLPEREQKLSPEYSPAAETMPPPPAALRGSESPKVTRAVQRFVNNAFATESTKSLNGGLSEPPPSWNPEAESKDNSSPFLTPPGTPLSPKTGVSSDDATPQFSYSGNPSLSGVNYKQVAAGAFEGVDLKWQPC